MALQTNSLALIDKIADSLVTTKMFASKEEAVWDLALTAIRNKMAHYKRRIQRLQRKYGSDFDEFTAQIQGSASPAQEDDWVAWHSARSMLADWQAGYQELLDKRSNQ